MRFASFKYTGDRPVLATAVHNGHDLRPEVISKMLLDPETRLREEDAHTDYFARRFENHVVVHRSRFEVDINRPRDEAVYRSADDAWGLDLWKGGDIDPALAEGSLSAYDEFYADLAVILDKLVGEHGGFVLYDIHSYNHRRGGPYAAPELSSENPTVNLGTGSLPGEWEPVADAFLSALRSSEVGGAPIDARENVKFQGRQVAAWTHANYGDVACSLAIEFKKVFMDEWTDEVDEAAQSGLADALMGTVEPVLDAWRSCVGD